MNMPDMDYIIQTLLKEYPPSMRFLKCAEYVPPNTLNARFRTTPNWACTASDSETSQVDHFTLGEAVFAHNQMAYITFASMAYSGNISGIKPLTIDDVNNKKFNKMLVAKFNMEFHKPIISSEEFSGVFKIDRHKVQRTESGIYVFIKNAFSFDNEKSFGSSTGSIQISDEEKK